MVVELSSVDTALIRKQLAACRKTLNLHEEVVAGHYDSYTAAKEELAVACPLCSVAGAGLLRCHHCPWYWFTSGGCLSSIGYDFHNSEESVGRLTEWIQWLEKELVRRG